MLSFLPAPILGVISLFLHALNVIFIPFLVLLVTPFSFIPIPKLRTKITFFIHEVIPKLWLKICDAILFLTSKTKWDIQEDIQLKPDGWYLLICNHQSWLDIIVLEKAFARKVPMLKFFMKKQLLWALPVAGVACWCAGFPFVTRYSSEYLKKHPEKKGKDLELTRRACEKFKNQPVTIMNYIEGTRFTNEKYNKQSSPYRHLLKPKAGGFSFVVSAMEEHLDGIINATIVYPPETSLWSFFCGKTSKIIVRYELLPMSCVPKGDYIQDENFREKFQLWTNELWHAKDDLIEKIKNENASHRNTQ